MTRARLELLNAFRWFKGHVISWALLSAIYSLTVTLILQPILERALKTELALAPLWAATCGLLLIPGVIEYLPAPAVCVDRRPFLRFMPERVFGEPLWRRGSGSLGTLYLRHEFRRLPTWIVIILSVLSAGVLPPGKKALWVLLAQLPTQRALYSLIHWRGLALAHSSKRGAELLLRALWSSQLLQALFCWIAVGVAGFLPGPMWAAMGPAVVGANLSASAVALEGDAGRPWLVNFMSLAAGTLAGTLCLASPAFLLAVLYFCASSINRVKARLHSVEQLDEDLILP